MLLHVTLFCNKVSSLFLPLFFVIGALSAGSQKMKWRFLFPSLSLSFFSLLFAICSCSLLFAICSALCCLLFVLALCCLLFVLALCCLLFVLALRSPHALKATAKFYLSKRLMLVHPLCGISFSCLKNLGS